MDFLKDLSIDKVRNLAEDAFNQAKPKTEVEARVYEVLSHKNWGSSSSLMNEIARDTFDYDKFAVVSQLMWESMENQRPAAWRVVFKGLTLLEHLIKNGSERCVDDARNHGHALRALFQFNYYEGTIDRGSGVREKAKQLVEILGDDERIREERMKARKLREKFGGNLGGVSGGGGSSSGGGGRYAGYGNDDWNSRGGSSGGYGEGGIGSERYRQGGGGRYDNDRDGGSSNGAYAGRYDEDRDTRSSTAAVPTPTFASLPDEPKKTKIKKKKKKDEGATDAGSTAPEIDLFAFDSAPTPAPVSAAPSAFLEPASEEFDAFQSAGSGTPVATTANSDLFAAAPAPTFDAFSGAAGVPPSTAPMMMPAMQQQPPPPQFDAFGGGISAPAMGGSALTGNNMSQQAFGGAHNNNSANFDDDFGDFASSTPSQTATASSKTNAAASSTSSSDPLSKLISLDGLSKNTSKEQALSQKLNAPIIANQAAATFVQERDQIQQSVQAGRKGNPAASFAGLDGLHKPGMTTMAGGGGIGGMNAMMSSMSLGSNPNVMGFGGGGSGLAGSGGGGGGDAISSLMDPQSLMPPKPQPPQPAVPQPQAGMAGGAGGMAMNPQMMMMMQQQFGMGQLTPQQQQQMMLMMMQQQQQQQAGQLGSMGMNQQSGFGGGQPTQGFGGSFNSMGGFQ